MYANPNEPLKNVFIIYNGKCPVYFTHSENEAKDVLISSTNMLARDKMGKLNMLNMNKQSNFRLNCYNQKITTKLYLAKITKSKFSNYVCDYTYVCYNTCTGVIEEYKDIGNASDDNCKIGRAHV